MKKNLFPIILIALGLMLRIVFIGQDYNAYLLIFAGLMLLLFKYAKKTVKRIVALILALGIGYFIFIEVPIISSSRGDTDVSADYLIVLGAAVHKGVPSLSMRERCDAAIEYLNGDPDCKVILSGGQGADESMSEADAMKTLLLNAGIDENRISIEDKSTSTYENLEFSSKLIEPGSVIAVCTSEYHLYRAKLIGKTLGMELRGVPAKTGYVSNRINYFIREAFGVTYQLISG